MKLLRHSIFVSYCFLSLSLGALAQSPKVGFLDAFEDETIAQARLGFFAALEAAGFVKDSSLQVIYRNAQGDMPTLVQANDYLLSQNVDLIACNPTTATITALQSSRSVPVCMMVSPHPSLIGLVDSAGAYPPNLLGVYETLDYIATSVELIKTLAPKTQKIGVIYNQAEPQSRNAYERINETCQRLGFRLIAKPINTSADTQIVVEALINEDIEAFFAMPDNLVFASFEVIFNSCQAAGIPVFTSEEGLVKRGAVAAYGANMYQWGYQAGEQAAIYLHNPSQGLPQIAAVREHQKLYNPEVAKSLGIKVPKGFEAVENEAKLKATSGKKGGEFRSFYLAALMLGLSFSALGFGVFISMRIFDIPDITTDGSYTLGASLTAVLLLIDLPIALIIPSVSLAGALAGIATGFIHTKLKINALLAGILVMTGLYSINLLIMGKSNLPLLDTANLLRWLEPYLGLVLSQLLILSILILTIWQALSYLLRSDFGLAMRATGNSESMIRANGVNTDRIKILGLGLANAFTALSGFLIVQYQGFADINMGIGIVIIGLGSVMIGESLSNWLGLRRIAWRLLAVLLGTVLFRLILAFTLAIGISPNLLKLITALLVLVVVALPNLKSSK